MTDASKNFKSLREDDPKHEDYGHNPIRTPIISAVEGDDRDSLPPSQREEPMYDDDVQDMTYSRRIARHLSKYRWYFPSSLAATEETSVTPPSLDAAWSYFEHQILPRHFYQDDTVTDNDKDTLEKAEPGESKRRTQLYSVWNTPETDLADFGIGVGLYFNTLRILSVILFIAGLLNIPNLIYFSSDLYTTDSQDSIQNRLLKGSAICTDVSWEACPTCTLEQWERYPSSVRRFATSTDGDGLTFMLVNYCRIDELFGIFSWLTLLFVVLAVYALGYYLGKKGIAFDEAQQTTPDYSISIQNPPKDAIDPDEWRTYFSQFSDVHVTVCTISLDNEDLVAALVKRRGYLLQLEEMLPPGLEFDEERLEQMVNLIPKVPTWKKILLCASEGTSIHQKLLKAEELIDELSNQKRNVTHVFITFETEYDQRLVLESLSLRRYDVLTQNVAALPEKYLFRGKHVLHVEEPDEPNAIRWDDLDETPSTRLLQQVVTGLLSLCLLVGGGVLIAWARRDSAFAASITITALNQITPRVVKKIVQFESHRSETTLQASTYTKITLFRWINTAIIIQIISPFTESLSDGSDYLINSVYAIFLTELIRRPLLHLLDIENNFHRHVLGPRAPDQRRMNLNFRGEEYQIAERYTDMTKTLLLTFFYCTLFPAGFFFASASLFVAYWTDKFGLLRSWRPGPSVGTGISLFSRHYFFPAAVLGYAIIASYSYASFPYDDGCDSGEPVSSNYLGDHTAITGEGEGEGEGEVIYTGVIEAVDTFYKFCNQDLFRFGHPTAFPALPTFQPDGSKWMNGSQETFAKIYGWSSVAVLCLVGATILMRTVGLFIWRYFFKSYKPSGKIMTEKFSELEEIFGYVPQVKVPGYEFPFLLCDVDGIDLGLIGWNDPHRPFSAHNLIYDVPKVAEKKMKQKKKASSSANLSSPSTTGASHLNETGPTGMDDDWPVFSIIRNWNPPGFRANHSSGARLRRKSSSEQSFSS